MSPLLRIVCLGLIFSLYFLGTACSSDDSNDPYPTTHIRLFHGVPDLESIDVYANQTRIHYSLNFNNFIEENDDYITVPYSKPFQLKIYRSKSQDILYLNVDLSKEIKQNGYHTVYLYGYAYPKNNVCVNNPIPDRCDSTRNYELQFKVLSFDPESERAKDLSFNNTMFRFVHLAPIMPKVSILDAQQASLPSLFDGCIGFGDDATNYIDRVPGINEGFMFLNAEQNFTAGDHTCLSQPSSGEPIFINSDEISVQLYPYVSYTAVFCGSNDGTVGPNTPRILFIKDMN